MDDNRAAYLSPESPITVTGPIPSLLPVHESVEYCYCDGFNRRKRQWPPRSVLLQLAVGSGSIR